MNLLTKPQKKLLSKLDTKMVLKLIVETQLNLVNPIYKTKDLLKVGLEVQQLVGLLSLMQANVYFVYKLYFISVGDSTVVAHSHNYSRSRRVIKFTDKVNVYRKSFGYLVIIEFDVDEPQSYKDVLRSKYAHFWMPAFQVQFLDQRGI